MNWRQRIRFIIIRCVDAAFTYAIRCLRFRCCYYAATIDDISPMPLFSLLFTLIRFHTPRCCCFFAAAAILLFLRRFSLSLLIRRFYSFRAWLLPCCRHCRHIAAADISMQRYFRAAAAYLHARLMLLRYARCLLARVTLLYARADA